MANFSTAKALAEDLVAKREIQKREDCSNEDFDAWHAAEIKFEEEVWPQVLLDLMADRDALIAELEALRKPDIKAGLMALAAYICPNCTAAVQAAMCKEQRT